MIIPIVVKNIDIIKTLVIGSSRTCKDFRHHSLHPVESHWDTSVLIFSKGCDDGMYLRYKNKGVVLHSNSNLGKVDIVAMALTDILQARDRIVGLLSKKLCEGIGNFIIREQVHGR